MISPHIIGSTLALLSAVFFGVGDICGGIASRRIGTQRTLFIATLSSVVVFGLLILLSGENLPSLQNFLWACGAGLFGFLGLIALFRGLASGNAAIVSPVSGVISASIPVAAAAIIQGFPKPMQVLGFIIALVGIWMVTRVSSNSASRARNGFWLGLGSGICFGLFFVLIARVTPGAVFFPLLFGKLTGFSLSAILLLQTNTSFPSIKNNLTAIISGVIDALANYFYLVSTHFTRLDIAAVITSLYPAMTVFLSMVFMKEHVRRFQWVGLVLCLLAIILITI